MKILFLGGTGLIGSAVAKKLIETPENELVILHRGNSKPEFSGKNVREIHADIRDDAQLKNALGNEKFDSVIDWIAFSTAHIKQDIEFFTGRTNQFIFISSASAYQKPCNHYKITESTPLINPYWQYSRDKAEIERILFSSDLPVTVVRPSHTYGRGGIPLPISSNHGWTPIQRILDGKPMILPGDGTSLWTTTYNTDFAVGFAGLVGQPRAIGHALHITSDEAISWNNIVKTVANALGVEAKLVHLPSAYIEHKYPQYAGHLLGDKAESVIFDNSKIKSFVPEFAPKVTFAEGVRKCLAWWEGKEKTIDENYNREMDELAEISRKLYEL